MNTDLRVVLLPPRIAELHAPVGLWGRFHFNVTGIIEAVHACWWHQHQQAELQGRLACQPTLQLCGGSALCFCGCIAVSEKHKGIQNLTVMRCLTVM